MEKKKYEIPRVEVIVLDNDISLALESNPPYGPFENFNTTTFDVNSNVDPFKSNT